MRMDDVRVGGEYVTKWGLNVHVIMIDHSLSRPLVCLKPAVEEVVLLLPEDLTSEEIYETLHLPVIDGCFDDMPKLYGGPNGDPYRQAKLLAPTNKTYTHREACTKFNVLSTGRLMTAEEIHLLIACGILRQGDTSFWSSSVVSFNRDYAWLFRGLSGNIFNRHRSNDYAVRCVARSEGNE